jgi:hypothetical protein
MTDTALPCKARSPRRFLATAMILGGPAILVYTGEVGGFAPALAQDQRAMVHPKVLGAFPPRAVSADELRTAISALGHWIPPHPRPYDPTGTAEFIGPRPIQKPSSAEGHADPH